MRTLQIFNLQKQFFFVVILLSSPSLSSVDPASRAGRHHRLKQRGQKIAIREDARMRADPHKLARFA
jgi:hypothetical protein